MLKRILLTLLLQNEKGLIQVVDAGGGTIDISAYRRTSPHNYFTYGPKLLYSILEETPT
jgi:hypothetical protein